MEVMVTMERDLLRPMLSQVTMVVMDMVVMVDTEDMEVMVTMERDLLRPMLSQVTMVVMDMVAMVRDLLRLSQDMDMGDMVVMVDTEVMDIEEDIMVKNICHEAKYSV